MGKIWPTAIIATFMYTSSAALADGVNTALSDPQVVPGPSGGAAVTAGTRPLTTAATGAGNVRIGGDQRLVGANATGRNGAPADQVYGHEVGFAYDHVFVGMAVLGGLFLMTEWMENR